MNIVLLVTKRLNLLKELLKTNFLTQKEYNQLLSKCYKRFQRFFRYFKSLITIISSKLEYFNQLIKCLVFKKEFTVMIEIGLI